MPRPARIARRLAAVTVALGGALVVCEVVARFVYEPIPEIHARTKGRIRGSVDHAPGLARELEFVLLPGSSCTIVRAGSGSLPDQEIRYEINADGFRGPLVPRERRADIPRVAVLGDSFTFGTGVHEHETLPAQLEPELEARLGGRDIEVMNWGVEAYQTRQEVAYLEWRWPEWRPDVVVLCMYVNDASGEDRGRKPETEAPWEVRCLKTLGLTSGVRPSGEELTSAERVTMTLRRCSRLVDVLAHRVYRQLRARTTRQKYLEDWSEGSPGLDMVHTALARGAAFAAQHGFELYVAMYPDLSPFDRHPFAGVHAQVGALCDELGLTYFDLLPALEDESPEALRAHLHDHHPGPRCHGLVAAYLAERLAPALRDE